ncbi:hypothetical protein IWW45_000120 [Coemansia sp. RSA 485]|nr:hypothetical protein IWW45_000120 [Coemansia sp. RSA 485]
MEDSRLEILADEVAGAPTFFREHVQFLDLLDKVVKSAGDSTSWTSERAPADEQRMMRELSITLELYQERPTCLDPYLERIVGQLMTVVQEYVYAYHDSTAESICKDTGDTDTMSVGLSRLSGVFDFLYTLCKVRGYKVIMRLFPHGVADVEPVFVTLWMHTSRLAESSWTTRYILLIWLSLLAMIPFDMESIDSGNRGLPILSIDGSPVVQQTTVASDSLIDRWIELGKLYLRSPACEMEGAAVMLSRLLSRKDTASSKQPAFIEWAISEICDAIGKNSDDSTSDAAGKKGMSIANVLRVNGVLRVLCHLFVAMDSAYALRRQMPLLIELFESDAFEQHSLTRKLITKATQRLALLNLPPVSATSIARNSVRKSAKANLGGALGQGSQASDDNASTISDECEANGTEVSEEVETFIGILLQKLQDKDTIVRWSAAKGIGRVTERLPPALAQEIVFAVADVLKEHALDDPSDGRPIDVSMTSEFAWHGALLALAELSRKGLLMSQALSTIVPWVVRGLTYEIQRGDYSVGSNVRDAACYVMWSFARMPNPESRRVFGKMSLQMSTTLISVAVFDRESNVRRAASAAFQEHVGRHSTFPHGISVLQLADFFSVGNMRNAFVVASRKIAEYDEYREPLLHHLCTGTIYHWESRTRELAAAALRELAPLAAKYVIENLLPQIVANTTSPFLAVRHGAIVATGVIAEVLAADLKELDRSSKLVLSVADNIPLRYLEDFGSSMTLDAIAQYMGCLSRAKWDIGGNERQQKYFEYFVQAFTACKEVDGIVSNFSAFASTYGISAEQHQQIVSKHITVETSGSSRENFVLALSALKGRDVFEVLCKLVVEGVKVEIRRNASAALGEFCRHSYNDKLRLAAGRLLEVLIYQQQLENMDYRIRRAVDHLRRYIPAQSKQIIEGKSANEGGILWTDAEAAFTRLAHALSVSEEQLRQPLFEGLVATGSVEPLGKYAVSAVADYVDTLPASSTASDPDNAESQSGWSVDGVVLELTRLLLTDRRTSKLINPALIVADHLIEQGSLNSASSTVWVPLYRAVQRIAFKLRAPQRLMLCLKLYSSVAMVSKEMAKMATESLLAHIGHPIPKIRQVAADHLYTLLCINGFLEVDDEDSMAEIDLLLTETEWMREDAGVKEARGKLTDLVKRILWQSV